MKTVLSELKSWLLDIFTYIKGMSEPILMALAAAVLCLFIHPAWMLAAFVVYIIYAVYTARKNKQNNDTNTERKD